MLSYHFLEDCAKHGYNFVFMYDGNIIKTTYKDTAVDYNAFMSSYDINKIVKQNPHLKTFLDPYSSKHVIYNPECWEVVNTSVEGLGKVNHLRYKGTSCTPTQPLGITNFWGLFRECTNLTELDLSDWTIKGDIFTVASMFEDCEKLEKVKLPHLEGVQQAAKMFRNCYNLKEINWEQFSDCNLCNCSNMFANCWRLEDFNLNKLGFSKSVNALNMFINCCNLSDKHLEGVPLGVFTNASAMFSGTGLIEVDMTKWGDIANNNYVGMFANCNKLEKAIIVIPDGIKVDAKTIFANCKKLNEAKIFDDKNNEIYTFNANEISMRMADDTALAPVAVF